MFNLPKNVSLQELDDCIQEVNSNDDDMVVPVFYQRGDLCELSRVFQLIFTWAGRDYQKDVFVPDEENARGRFQNFAKTILGTILLNFCRRAVFEKGELLSRRMALEMSEEFVRGVFSSKFDSINNDSSIVIINIDNSKELKNHPLLYNEKGHVRGRKHFQYLVGEVISRICPDVDPLIRENIDPISVFVHEAFLNTEEHAKTDFYGRKLKRSVRGIVFDYKDKSIDDVKDEVVGIPRLKDYFSSWSSKGEGKDRVKYLEVSVFDAGPGIVQTLAPKEYLGSENDFGKLPIGDHYKIIKKSLEFGFTSKDNASRGMGLPTLLRALKSVGGVLMIRTGNLNLIKCFPVGNDWDVERNDTVMEDIREKASLKRSPSAVGTVVSALIPLNKG
ncbi:hypothetical protein [Thalassospira lucentensis]|uniref:hypothetical protein n=1 Tax=Thalassospira lucentensis TaxID=168935 RepID=UPI003AA7D81E